MWFSHRRGHSETRHTTVVPFFHLGHIIFTFQSFSASSSPQVLAKCGRSTKQQRNTPREKINMGGNKEVTMKICDINVNSNHLVGYDLIIIH
jgi:hypothetical protein